MGLIKCFDGSNGIIMPKNSLDLLAFFFSTFLRILARKLFTSIDNF